MSGTCATIPTDPNYIANAAKEGNKPISSSVPNAALPNFDLSSAAMYPTVLGWAVLYAISALLFMFLGAYLGGVVSIVNWWSTFIWSALVCMLAVLASINGSYNAMLVNMTMCADALKSFITVAMTTLAAITIVLWYIMYYEFGTNQNTTTYLLVMLHVNFFASIVNLCMVTMHKLSGLNIPGTNETTINDTLRRGLGGSGRS